MALELYIELIESIKEKKIESFDSIFATTSFKGSINLIKVLYD